MPPLFAGHNHRAPSSLRDAALHHQRFAGFHASCSHSTQRHCFLLWQPQSLGYGMAEHFLHEFLMFQWKFNWELNVKIHWDNIYENKWVDNCISFLFEGKGRLHSQHHWHSMHQPWHQHMGNGLVQSRNLSLMGQRHKYHKYTMNIFTSNSLVLWECWREREGGKEVNSKTTIIKWTKGSQCAEHVASVRSSMPSGAKAQFCSNL